MNLLNESDCTKWLTDFEEKTNTFWKADKDASQVVSQAHKVKFNLLEKDLIKIKIYFFVDQGLCLADDLQAHGLKKRLSRKTGNATVWSRPS